MADADDGKDVVPETLEQAEQLTDLQLLNARREKLSRIAHEIESILIREDMTWGDWGEVVEMFSSRIGQQVAIIKVTKIE